MLSLKLDFKGIDICTLSILGFADFYLKPQFCKFVLTSCGLRHKPLGVSRGSPVYYAARVNYVGEGGGIAAYRGMSAHPITGGSANYLALKLCHKVAHNPNIDLLILTFAYSHK